MHGECVDFAAADCKENATYCAGSEPRHVHHWREGNLPANSKCSACRRACWSAECLTGYRCEWCGSTVRTATLYCTSLGLITSTSHQLMKVHSPHSATQDVAPSYRTIATLGCCSRSSCLRRRCRSHAPRCPWRPSSACTCGRRPRSAISAAVSVPQTVPGNTACRHVHVPRNSQRAYLV